MQKVGRWHAIPVLRAGSLVQKAGRHAGRPDQASPGQGHAGPGQVFEGQRSGGAYCRPPLVHSAFGPRCRPIGARLRSKISP